MRGSTRGQVATGRWPHLTSDSSITFGNRSIGGGSHGQTPVTLSETSAAAISLTLEEMPRLQFASTGTTTPGVDGKADLSKRADHD